MDISQGTHPLETLESKSSDSGIKKYCQVTIGEKNDGALLEITSQKAGIAKKKLRNILSKSQASSSDSLYHHFLTDTSSYGHYVDGGIEKEKVKNGFIIFDTDIHLSPPSSDEDFELPARSSELFHYHSSSSTQSIVEEIITPPMHFGNCALSDGFANGTITEDDLIGGKAQRFRLLEDRNSTESYDTGYTSGHGQSPGFSERTNLATVDEATPMADENSVVSSRFINRSKVDPFYPQEIPSDLSLSSIRSSSVQHSQNSYGSTDSMRFYVPLVFQKSKEGTRGKSFKIAVCLVENSDHVIKVSSLFIIHYFVSCYDEGT